MKKTKEKTTETVSVTAHDLNNLLSLTLNAIREEKKMTKKEFAASLGISVYKLKTWTEKYHNFTILDLSLIKEKLGINFDISFNTEEKENNKK